MQHLKEIFELHKKTFKKMKQVILVYLDKNSLSKISDF